MAEDDLLLLADAQTSGGLLIAGEIPGAPVIGELVPASGPVSSAPQGVLASGSGGYLYVAAGRAVAVVNPQAHQVIKQIPASGQVSSVAVAPDGSTVYAGSASSTSLRLLAYNPATGAQVGSSAVARRYRCLSGAC